MSSDNGNPTLCSFELTEVEECLQNLPSYTTTLTSTGNFCMGDVPDDLKFDLLVGSVDGALGRASASLSSLEQTSNGEDQEEVCDQAQDEICELSKDCINCQAHILAYAECSYGPNRRLMLGKPDSDNAVLPSARKKKRTRKTQSASDCRPLDLPFCRTSPAPTPLPTSPPTSSPTMFELNTAPPSVFDLLPSNITNDGNVTGNLTDFANGTFAPTDAPGALGANATGGRRILIATICVAGIFLLDYLFEKIQQRFHPDGRPAPFAHQRSGDDDETNPQVRAGTERRSFNLSTREEDSNESSKRPSSRRDSAGETVDEEFIDLERPMMGEPTRARASSQQRLHPSPTRSSTSTISVSKTSPNVRTRSILKNKSQSAPFSLPSPPSVRIDDDNASGGQEVWLKDESEGGSKDKVGAGIGGSEERDLGHKVETLDDGHSKESSPPDARRTKTGKIENNASQELNVDEKQVSRPTGSKVVKSKSTDEKVTPTLSNRKRLSGDDGNGKDSMPNTPLNDTSAETATNNNSSMSSSQDSSGYGGWMEPVNGENSPSRIVEGSHTREHIQDLKKNESVPSDIFPQLKNNRVPAQTRAKKSSSIELSTN